MLAFKWNLCGANRFSHLWETGDSLRDIKIRFLSITFELPTRSLCCLWTKVLHCWDLSFDIQFVKISAELYEKIDLQHFYYFAHNFWIAQPISIIHILNDCKFEDLSFDTQFVQIEWRVFEKIDLQCFHIFPYNFYNSQPIAKLFNSDLLGH